ncbi:hypothetical protein [Paenibacillus spongiae]|uniref:DUF1801 domain-containing protein n=1 Tax=Paenibacillus spongiae TaxID=2909671 RepID=A0ABY5SDH3_9BACL|nr:hypothetical protein [Paenibacillus spongiae]UVI30738.1 hypothetical protein L1F29_02330 [Paenibacillus spongiae]
MSDTEFAAIFARLKQILLPYEASLDVKADTDINYYLDTFTIYPANKLPIFFGAVTWKKNYVSFHLMPVYVNPSLLDGISTELRKRMQGKSCFNFKRLDEGLFQELEQLTASGAQDYKGRGFI